jgi:hypothetical protein
MALATLVNGAAYIHHDNGFGGIRFVYFVWGAWWLDIVLSFASCFGMIYFMRVLSFVFRKVNADLNGDLSTG